MENKLDYSFLQLEFAELYKDFKEVEEEKDLHWMCTKILNLLEDMVRIIYSKNKLYFDRECDLLKNIESLNEIDALPNGIEELITSCTNELRYIKEEKEELIGYINDLKPQIEIIYELSVWLVLNYGEENYTLFYDKLTPLEKLIFDKYIDKGFIDEELEFDDSEECEEEIDDEDEIETIYIISDDEDKNIFDSEEEFEEEEDEDEENENLQEGEEYFLGGKVDRDYVKARALFEKAAKEGNKYAQGYLAIFYEKGLGGDKDISKAIYWYKKSALKGNSFSQYSLGYIYFSGKYIEKNLEYAFQWYKKAAENDFPAAQYALSYLYKNGIGCEEDVFKAYYWLEESADNNFEDAFYILGESYLEGSYVEINYAKAFLYLSKGANKNDENCLESLGDMYYWGLHVNKDIDKAFELYRKSVDQGNLKLYYKLARLYEDEDDMEKAIMYYLIGHNSGDTRATQKLGSLYYKGKGVEKNLNNAVQYMLLAAEEKSAYALYFIGIHYLSISREKGIKYLKEAYKEGSASAAEALASELLIDIFNEEEVDYDELLEYISFGMENDKKESIYYYGLIHAYGIGVEKSYEEAFKYIKEGAEKGSEKAMLKLANWYKHGIFVKENPKEAIRWYEEAAKNNNIDALLNIIEMYEKGIGIKRDYDKAFNLIKTLKDINLIEGNLKLAYYYAKGIGVNINNDKVKLYIEEIMESDKKKALNLLGALAEEELYNLRKEDAIGYYEESSKEGYGKGYVNLQYRLLKDGKDTKEYLGYEDELLDKEYFVESGKYVYVKAKRLLDSAMENDDKDQKEDAIRNLKRSVRLGFYEGITDIISYYENQEETKDNLINLYKYKQKLNYYGMD